MKTSNFVLLAMLFSTFASGAAFAGTGGGAVSQVAVLQGGKVIFKTATHGNGPVCASNPNDWAIDTGTASGKAIFALLLTAVNQGKSVTVSGTNTCDAWPDRETAAQLFVNY